MSAQRICVTAMMMTAMLLFGGCASSPKADGKRHAQCLVCKCNADLGCLDVVVDARTPTTTYQGKAYYFCGESCRDKFAANPAKYADQK